MLQKWLNMTSSGYTVWQNINESIYKLVSRSTAVVFLWIWSFDLYGILIYSSYKVNACLDYFEYSAQVECTTIKVFLWCIFVICIVIVRKRTWISCLTASFVVYGRKKVIQVWSKLIPLRIFKQAFPCLEFTFLLLTDNVSLRNLQIKWIYSMCNLAETGSVWSLLLCKVTD